MLTEIRWHGRAGQGIITVCRLLAQSAISEGKHAQAFPEFGPERIGAPIAGYTRISNEPIRVHSRIYEPDIVIVLDQSVAKIVDTRAGIKKGGKYLINTKEEGTEFKDKIVGVDAYSLDATRISLDVLGNTKALNTIMLGALVKISKLVSMDSVLSSLKERFSGMILEKNLALVKKGYGEVKEV
jgi:pyruvate ferredoxin oxidoreductase gamma subunit